MELSCYNHNAGPEPGVMPVRPAAKVSEDQGSGGLPLPWVPQDLQDNCTMRGDRETRGGGLVGMAGLEPTVSYSQSRRVGRYPTSRQGRACG